MLRCCARAGLICSQILRHTDNLQTDTETDWMKLITTYHFRDRSWLKSCNFKVDHLSIIMSLALHYWMGDAHHCSGPPVSEMTCTVSSGTLNSTIPYHTICRGCSIWTITQLVLGRIFLSERRLTKHVALHHPYNHYNVKISISCMKFFSIDQSHIFERVVPTGPITMLQLLIGLIQSCDNRGRHVLSSETTDVEGYENG